jgi:dipeptidyl aminopeptidase/acylaminoacyl peptidase
MDANGDNNVQLTQDTDKQQQPSWSPDGRRLLFTVAHQMSNLRTTYIFKMRADGSHVVQLTTFNSSDPAWSPDGRRIVFTKGPDGQKGVFVMGPDGSHAHKLSRGYVGTDSPAWAPDGKHIVFCAVSHELWRIITMTRRGHNKKVILKGASGQGVAWSPNGQKILFVTTDHSIHTVHPSGHHKHKLVENGVSPDWQPR